MIIKEIKTMVIKLDAKDVDAIKRTQNILTVLMANEKLLSDCDWWDGEKMEDAYLLLDYLRCSF